MLVAWHFLQIIQYMETQQVTLNSNTCQLYSNSSFSLLLHWMHLHCLLNHVLFWKAKNTGTLFYSAVAEANLVLSPTCWTYMLDNGSVWNLWLVNSVVPSLKEA